MEWCVDGACGVFVLGVCVVCDVCGREGMREEEEEEEVRRHKVKTRTPLRMWGTNV